MTKGNESGGSFPLSIPLDDIPTYVNCPTDIIERNIFANASSGLPFLLDQKFEKRNDPLAIVGGGPSLLKTIEELRQFKHVMVCSSAHDYLVENGIVPEFAMFCDAMPNPPYYKKHHQDCIYLIATQCDPSLLERLGSRRILLWDSNGWEDEKIYMGRLRIVGGTSAALRAPALGMVLGFSDFHFFGVDSSFQKDRFAYFDDTDIAEEFTILFEGEEFTTTLHLAAQAQDFQKMLTNYGHLFSVTVYGDSLFAAVWKDMRRKADALLNNRRMA